MNVPRHTTTQILQTIEARFMDVADLEGDFSTIPMPKKNHLQVKTDIEKSNSFGEVFTPIWLVDQMIERISDYDLKKPNKKTLDLCSGYGQFTIRLLRKKYDLLNDKFDIKNFLFNTHYFSELQLASCYKLLHIYSSKINLFIGDSKHLSSLPENCSGIFVYKNGWQDCTEFVKEIFGNPRYKYNKSAENKFVNKLQGFMDESEKPS